MKWARAARALLGAFWDLARLPSRERAHVWQAYRGMPLGELVRSEIECTCRHLARTGGVHHRSCPAWEPECTCYEALGGHTPGCYYARHPQV